MDSSRYEYDYLYRQDIDRCKRQFSYDNFDNRCQRNEVYNYIKIHQRASTQLIDYMIENGRCESYTECVALVNLKHK